RPGRRSAAPSAGRRRPAGGGNPAPTPGAPIFAGRPRPSIIPTPCRWPRGSSSASDHGIAPAARDWKTPPAAPIFGVSSSEADMLHALFFWPFFFFAPLHGLFGLFIIVMIVALVFGRRRYYYGYAHPYW